MTMPGPILIKQCPECGQYIREQTIASGNTLGQKCWSDGKVEAPMLPEVPRAVLCPGCRKIVWIRELAVCEALGGFFAQENFRSDVGLAGRAKDWLPLEVNDYLLGLQQDLPEDKESFLRIRLWWCGNDPLRRGEQRTRSADEIGNMERLIMQLPDDDQKTSLMKADLLRSLRRFGEAEKLLNTFQYPAREEWVVAKLLEMVAAEDACIARLY